MTRTPAQRRKIGIVLTVVFTAALLMGPGPGMVIANRPVTWFGLPALYVWGLGTYLVEVVVVVLAYRLVWNTDADDSKDSADIGHET